VKKKTLKAELQSQQQGALLEHHIATEGGCEMGLSLVATNTDSMCGGAVYIFGEVCTVRASHRNLFFKRSSPVLILVAG
jgi:hypothetical protein